MNTLELESLVRDQTLEYDQSPCDPQYIVRLLNGCYSYVYNHFVKSNDMLFAQEHLMQISAGTSEYELPKNLWNKRVEQVEVPSPVQESMTPWGYVKIPIVSRKEAFPYISSKIRTYFPQVVSIMNNVIGFYPLPLTSFTAHLIINRRIPALGIFGGRITALGNNVITVESLNDPRINANKAVPSLAFISISDQLTGEIKAMYSYSAVDTVANTITLAAAPVGRTQYLTYPIGALPGSTWTGLAELDDNVTFGYTTGTSIFGEAFDQFLVDWAVLRIRGSLNETDPSAMETLKLQLEALRGDTGGRVLGQHIQRTRFNNIPQSRPVGRR
jgi:hypothetical protein